MFDYFFGDFTFVQIAGLLLSAFLIGVNKTGIPGIGTLPVVLLSLLFPAKFSTGLQLIMLCTADLFAVAYYHRGANWKLLVKLLPCALCGIAIGSLTLHYMNDTAMSIAIGTILILLSGVHFFRTCYLKNEDVPSHWAFTMFVGLMAGFTTQIANAAGPVMALYLLAMRLDKKEYMGTAAMYFMILNWIKLPIFVFEGRIEMKSVMLDLPMLPILLLGAAAGIWFFKKISQKGFDTVIHTLVILSAIWLLVKVIVF